MMATLQVHVVLLHTKPSAHHFLGPDHPFSVHADDLSLCVFVAFLSELGQRF
jgi:hypothetical protein